MIILHYFIGFPEERHGGASKYVAELMKAQNSISGTHAVAITPGETFCYGRKSRIVNVEQRHGIRCFEITNPPIAPLLYGLKKASYILRDEKKWMTIILKSFIMKSNQIFCMSTP